MNNTTKTTRRLRYGMIGGGRGAFIGAVHRMAARIDDSIELVAGCFSRDPEVSFASGAELHIAPDRVYSDYGAMALAEAARPPAERLDFVSVVTRTDTHADIAEAFIKADFHVICEKPLATRLEDACRLRDLVDASGRLLVLMHNYTGYPMIREAREHIRAGGIGRILKVIVEYSQGYAVGLVDADVARARNWRSDPTVAGLSNCMADIGTHAFNLACHVTGLRVHELCADLSTFCAGSTLDDDGACLLRFDGGARGVLLASQVCSGEENNLRLRVYGTKGALEWHQEEPNELILKVPGQPMQTWRRANRYLSPASSAYCRLPAGHPEAFLEAFANLYRETARAITDLIDGQEPPEDGYGFPDVEDGVRGVAFVEAVVASSRSSGKWTRLVER
jgi:predicted dehydrogenase